MSEKIINDLASRILSGTILEYDTLTKDFTLFIKCRLWDFYILKGQGQIPISHRFLLIIDRKGWVTVFFDDNHTKICTIKELKMIKEE